MSNAKATINLHDGVIELEGDVQFVSKYLDKFQHVIEKLEHLQTTGKPQERPAGGATAAKAEEPENPPRKKTKKGGPSCGERIRGLQTDNFFSSPQTSMGVKEALRTKGFTYEGKAVAAALNWEVKQTRLRRVKEGATWQYVNP